MSNRKSPTVRRRTARPALNRIRAVARGVFRFDELRPGQERTTPRSPPGTPC